MATDIAQERTGDAPAHPLGPKEIREMIMGFGRAKALMSGVELGVFDGLSSGPLTPQELARRLDLPAVSLRSLVIYLCSVGLLEKQGDAYANSPSAGTYLVSGRPAFMGGGMRHVGHDLYPLWNYLSDAIRENSNRFPQAFPGRDQDPFAGLFRDPEAMRGVLAAMTSVTTPVARELCQRFDFNAHRCLLDVGSALGTLPITVLQAFPHLQGISFDLPAVRPLAEESIAAAGLGDRLQVASGDMFTDPLPTGADLITLSMILHDWDEQQCHQILETCHTALASGGAILVSEALVNDEGTGPELAAYGSLNMLVVSRGRNRSGKEYMALLTQAGFERPEVRMFSEDSMRHLVVAWKA